MELAIAFSVFVILASVVTFAVGGAAVSQHRQRLSVAAQGAMRAALAELANSPYSAISGGTFSPPSPCTAGSVGTSAQSCLYPLGPAGGALKVSWAVSAQTAALGAAGVQVTASATLSDGQLISLSRVIDAPVPDYAQGYGTLEVNVSGLYGYSPSGMTAPLLVLGASGAAVATAQITSGSAPGTGYALFHVPNGSCTSSAPCRFGLRTGAERGWLAGSGGLPTVALSAASVLGPGSSVVVGNDGLAQASVALYQPVTASLLLTATNSGTAAAPPTEAGSVCLWASFNDGVANRSEPFCNNGPSAGEIVAATYEVSGTSLALPTSTPLSWSVDDPNGTCPQVAGMVGYSSSGWAPAAVCTGWTWGTPGEFGPTGGVLGPFSGASTTLVAGQPSTYDVVWTGDAASPAAGYSGEPVWGKPREAAGCAFVGTCLSLGTQVPEDSLCPGGHCLSLTHFAPELTAPASGLSATATVLAGAGQTTFPVTITDPDLDLPTVALTATVTSLPTHGSLSFGGTAVAVGTVLVGGAPSPWTGQLTYTRPSGFSGLDTFGLHLDGGQGVSTDVTIGLYEANQPWVVQAQVPSGAQGSVVTATVTVVGTNGQPFAGASVTGAASAPQTSVASATTTSNGTALVPITIGASPSGNETVSFTATGGGGQASGSATLAVSPTVMSLSSSGATLTLGSSATLTVTALDMAGAGVPGSSVYLSISGPSGGVYLTSWSCTTGAGGDCSAQVVASSGATAGSYTVTASTSSVVGGVGNQVSTTTSVQVNAP